MRTALLVAAVAAAGCGSGATLRLGVAADTNGATAATLANLDRLVGVFAEEHVDGVLALGDLGANEEEIGAVLTRLGRAGAPVYALVGEREPEAAFHAAVKRLQAGGARVVDLVDVRGVQLSGGKIVAVPGYAFAHDGYRTGAADYARAKTEAAKHQGALIIAAHTPPKGDGPNAADWAIGDVNAGSPAMRDFLDDVHPDVALFAHVDEAGGRGDGHRLNVGAVERGMAAIVEVRRGAVKERVLQ